LRRKPGERWTVHFALAGRFHFDITRKMKIVRPRLETARAAAAFAALGSE
jgi:hypothetical protein